MPLRILVTGGAGFIGSAVIRHILAHSGHFVFNLDKLSYAASAEALGAADNNPRYSFRRGDIGDKSTVAEVVRGFQPQAVLHLAAETHVDRSIDGPEAFFQTNVIGTMRLLEVARSYWGELPSSEKPAFRFCHVSTDEVFGALTADAPAFTESTPYDPRSPYSASKAASDHAVRAWGHTYGLPVLISNASNNFGPWQFPEKLIPLTILKALRGEPLPVYGTGQNVRDWLFVEDHARALLDIVERGVPGESYLVGGNAERRNIDVVKAIADAVDELAGALPSGRPRTDLISFVSDRPGHDFRYAMNTSKIAKELGWHPAHQFDEGLRATVEWYLDNRPWWEGLRDRYKGQRLGTSSPPTGS